MKRVYGNLSIREVTIKDASQLCEWWNDGKIMNHAGFPKGINTTLEIVTKQITMQNNLESRHIILYCATPIGEMVYRIINKKTCKIGIKICNFSMQNKGYGKIILSLFIDGLFHEYNFERIILNTDLNNKRAQHVYEQLGFKKVCINENSWRDQEGNLRSTIDYELIEKQFVSYL